MTQGLPLPQQAAAPALDPGPRAQGARAQRRTPAAGWPLSRMIAVGIAIMALFSVASIVTGAIALTDLSGARSRVVDKLDPAAYQASQLYAALLNQETGVRGYALSAQQRFLQPYTLGVAGERQALTQLDQVLTGMPAAQHDVTQVLSRVADWRTGYAEPTITRVQATGSPVVKADVGQGKADFDSLRATMAALQKTISAQRRQSLAGLARAATVLDAACVSIACGLLLVVILLTLGIRNAAIRPLSRLAADARQIADGDFDHELSRSGPREFHDLGSDLGTMRDRIVSELAAARGAHAALEARTEDLQRSNSELEQFAYVASHDLQEPLRKVASFCQLLQRRYGGRLDERADQYIEYAVDGAKRMQMLINDLLAFSRVGRIEQERAQIDASDLLAQAESNLATAMRKARARVDVTDLPTISAEPTLLTAVFQNLLSNAIKFHGEQPPHITVSARRDGEFWLFSFADNGIGIQADYAERIFVIFQRLHDKSSYPGTGIGLAMCRKIIEYHGGRIWLDTSVTTGSRFLFTLPVIPDPPEPDHPEPDQPEPGQHGPGQHGTPDPSEDDSSDDY